MAEYIIGRELRLWEYIDLDAKLVLLARTHGEHKSPLSILIGGVTEISIATSFMCDKITWDADAEEKIIQLHSGSTIHRVVASTISHVGIVTETVN